jgi:hypothetical protein
MFQLFESEKHLKSTLERFYGLYATVNPEKIYPLIRDASHVIVLELEASDTISQNLIQFFVDKKIAGLKKNIRELHFHIFKHNPNSFIVEYIFQQYLAHLKQDKTELNSMVHAFNDLKKLA